ncbi:MAG TPA: hypothetical protein VFV25_07540, partial [Methylibium sp.]
LIVYELQPALNFWGRLWQRLKAFFLHWHGPRRDRDPTFADRLAADEMYWSKALGRAEVRDKASVIQRRGALLAPASAPAVQYRPAGGEGRSAHVVLVHGGLSSVRNAFEAWLAPQATEQAPLWPGMPIFDAACVWRFEHDSFLSLDKNIAALCEAMRSRVVGNAAGGGRIVFLTHSRGGAVVRFALPQLQASWPQWSFHALTAGAPHDGTPVFGQLGQRWVGLASLVGVLGRAADGLLDREQMAKLKNLERGLAGDIPPGFDDVTPQNIRLRARGEEFPVGIETWGSHWRADFADDWSDQEWHHVVEGVVGLEADGDGMIPLNSAKMGPVQNDASPAFHTEYFHHRVAVAAMRARIEALLSKN